MGNTNETLIQVPSDLSEPLQLKKFLLALVEKLDIILGYRGQDPYITVSDLQTSAETLAALPQTLETIQEDISTLQTDLNTAEGIIFDLQNTVGTVTIGYDTTQALAVAYNDFNYTGYFTLKGRYQFTALGSAITNPPAGAGLVGVTSYTVFISSYTTSGGGVVQEAYITSATTKTFHKRAGNTSALVLSLGWF